MKTQMLFKAVQNNRLTELADLLKKGANVNTVNQQHKSLLLVATEKQFVNMAKLLIEYGADVNLQDNRLESPFPNCRCPWKFRINSSISRKWCSF